MANYNIFEICILTFVIKCDIDSESYQILYHIIMIRKRRSVVITQLAHRSTYTIPKPTLAERCTGLSFFHTTWTILWAMPIRMCDRFFKIFVLIVIVIRHIIMYHHQTRDIIYTHWRIRIRGGGRGSGPQHISNNSGPLVDSSTFPIYVIYRQWICYH